MHKLQAQLDTSNINARRLETELIIAEQQIQTLQNKLDDIKRDTTSQIDLLKTQLKEASLAKTRLESTLDDSNMSNKQLRGQNDAQQRQLAEIQRQFENAMREKEVLQTSCRELRCKLDKVQRDLARSKEVVANLDEKMKKSEEGRISATTDANSTHQTLSRIEQAHAKLVSEHAALQASFTSSEKQNTSLQLELKSAMEKVSELEKQNEKLAQALSEVENKLKVVTKSCQMREQDLAYINQKATILERERNELTGNLSKLQEDAHFQGKVDAAKQSELQTHISQLKSTRDMLLGQVSTLESALEKAQRQNDDADAKLDASKHKGASLASQLKQSDGLYKDVQASYSQLVGVLEGTLGLSPQLEQEGMTLKVRMKDLSASVDVSRAESGLGGSILSPPSSLESSFNDSQGQSFFKSPSKLTQPKLDSKKVRDTILEMQKKVMVAERTKSEAVSTSDNIQKKIQQVEEEKSSYEARLKSLRASLVSLQASFDTVVKQRDVIEQVSKAQSEELKAQKSHAKKLECQVHELTSQVENDRLSKHASNSKIKEYAHIQAENEIKKNRLEMKVKELEKQEKELEEVIVKLKTNAVQLQVTHETKDAEVSRLQQKLITSQQLYRESDAQKNQLQNRIKELEQSIADMELRQAQLSTIIQSVQMELQEQEGGNRKLESQLSDLVRQKQELTASLKRVQSDLDVARKEKQIANDLCSSLEGEIENLRKELYKLREDNQRLKSDLREANFQTHRLDVLVASQQRQKSELDHSLVESSKQNIDLIRSTRELKASMAEKEKEHQQK